MDEKPNDVARQLNDWFQSVVQLVEDSLFSVAAEGPHRDAVILDSLRPNARTLYTAKSEPECDTNGSLYSPLCFFLVAACRRLHATLGVGHWLAALKNVLGLRHQWGKVRGESLQVGLDIRTPATLYKSEFDEATHQAGLADGRTVLNKENQQVALGLAVNWGMRLLLAYAAEAPRTAPSSGRRDLAWLANLIQQTERAVADQAQT